MLINEIFPIIFLDCMRQLEMILGSESNESTDLYSRYECDRYGNFLPIQCSPTVCYCVDEYGFQIGEEVFLSEKDQLIC